MDPKKINPQDAFDLVTRRQGEESTDPLEKKNIEDGFGEKMERSPQSRPAWKRYLLLGSFVMLTCLLVSGVVAFYWFVVHESEPDVVVHGPIKKGPASISEGLAKEMIEVNLRAFLRAESNEERLKFIYMPEDEEPSLEVYYGKRGHVDTHLWNVERIESVASAQGEIWFVVYQDVKKKQRLASFQRYGDDYLLHWSAMTAYCEIPWAEFIVGRPVGPVTMRCYVRHYGDIWPVGVSRQEYHCFIVEDREGIFSEAAVIKLDAPGCSILQRLSKKGRHPVTVDLGYQETRDAGAASKRLRILSLKHLRWQKMPMDPALQQISP